MNQNTHVGDTEHPLSFKVVELMTREAANLALTWEAKGFVVRTVRGAKMSVPSALFDEISAAFQFPYYFGENWAALDECLSDLDWFVADMKLAILVLDAASVLPADDDLQIFARILLGAAETYAAPISQGAPWDRPPLIFDIVLHAQPGGASALLQRWQAAGADLVPLE